MGHYGKCSSIMYHYAVIFTAAVFGVMFQSTFFNVPLDTEQVDTSLSRQSTALVLTTTKHTTIKQKQKPKNKPKLNPTRSHGSLVITAHMSVLISK